MPAKVRKAALHHLSNIKTEEPPAPVMVSFVTGAGGSSVWAGMHRRQPNFGYISFQFQAQSNSLGHLGFHKLVPNTGFRQQL